MEWDFKRAEQEFKKAVKMNANSTQLLYVYGSLLSKTGRDVEALGMARLLRRIDPLSQSGVNLTSEINIANRRFSSNLKMLKEEQKTLIIYNSLGKTLMGLQRYDEVIDLMGEAFEALNYSPPAIVSNLVIAHHRLGNIKKANEYIEELKERLKINNAGSINFFLGLIYSAIGNNEEALEYIEKSYEAGEVEMIWLKIEPGLESLHDNLRYQELLRKVGFPE